MPDRIPASCYDPHAIAAEYGKRWWTRVMKRSRQNTIDIPEAGGAVMRRREKTAAIRTELHVLNQLVMPADDSKWLGIPDAPNAQRPVL